MLLEAAVGVVVILLLAIFVYKKRTGKSVMESTKGVFEIFDLIKWVGGSVVTVVTAVGLLSGEGDLSEKATNIFSFGKKASISDEKMASNKAGGVSFAVKTGKEKSVDLTNLDPDKIQVKEKVSDKTEQTPILVQVATSSKDEEKSNLPLAKNEKENSTNVEGNSFVKSKEQLQLEREQAKQAEVAKQADGPKNWDDIHYLLNNIEKENNRIYKVMVDSFALPIYEDRITDYMTAKNELNKLRNLIKEQKNYITEQESICQKVRDSDGQSVMDSSQYSRFMKMKRMIKDLDYVTGNFDRTLKAGVSGLRKNDYDYYSNATTGFCMLKGIEKRTGVGSNVQHITNFGNMRVDSM